MCSKTNSMKANRLNVLLLGCGETTSFIKNCKKFQWNDPDNSQHLTKVVLGYPAKPYERTTEITSTYLSIFGEKYNFIDTPGNFTELSLYKGLKILNIEHIDAILIFVNHMFMETQHIMETLFSVNNVPKENIIFVVIAKKINGYAFRAQFEAKLRKLQMTTSVSLYENLFILGDVFYEHNTMLSFSYRLQNVCCLRPCTFQFKINIPDLLRAISNLFDVLIEVLHMFSANIYQKRLYVSPLESIISKKSKENIIFCHEECLCFAKEETETETETEKCFVFNADGICNVCKCGIEDHVSTRFYLKRYMGTTERWSEKNAILHFLATLYQFSKLRYGLPERCKNLKKEYWSTVTMDIVSSNASLYEELEMKIEEFNTDFQQPTPEEVTVLIDNFLQEEWHSFSLNPNYRNRMIPINCELKLIANGNPMETVQSAGGSRASQVTTKNRKQQKFPEMKNLPIQTAGAKGKGELAEDEDNVLENLLKEVQQQKKEIANLQQQIEDLKK